MDATSEATQILSQSIDSSLNPTSPYYLHPDENPGFILVSPPFDGGNYHSWSRSMKRALLDKNKFKFVNGTIGIPLQYHENSITKLAMMQLTMTLILSKLYP
ncbi:hypothetical protein Lal_00018177 [Lupinus albus]|nr:hypothetical protein Lal_00018177 [Lupinus albus]